MGGLKHVWAVHPSRELRAPDGMEDIHQDGRRDIGQNRTQGTVHCNSGRDLASKALASALILMAYNSESFYLATKTLGTARLEQ